MTIANQKKVAKANRNRYTNSTLYGLYYAYAKPSIAKQNAWNYCVNLMDKYNGYGLRVISYNTFMFTAAFLFLDENGVVNMMYITPNYDIAIEF
jgi:hypothetical protein